MNIYQSMQLIYDIKIYQLIYKMNNLNTHIHNISSKIKYTRNASCNMEMIHYNIIDCSMHYKEYLQCKMISMKTESDNIRSSIYKLYIKKNNTLEKMMIMQNNNIICREKTTSQQINNINNASMILNNNHF